MPLKVHRDQQTTINLTPLIDIVFLLIIFFMVGTQFSELTKQEKNIPLEIPTVSSGAALTAAPDSRVINVLKDGQIMLDEQSVSLDQLLSELVEIKKQYNQIGVVIRGDAKCAYDRVTNVIATCKEAEINHLNISVKRLARVPSGTTR